MHVLIVKLHSRLLEMLVAVSLVAGLPGWAAGQTSYPMITHVLPVAVQRGHASEVEVFGQMDFAGTYKAMFEGAGLSAEILTAPPKAKQKAGTPVKTVKLRVTASKDATCGVREFRLASDRGISSIGQIVVVDEPVVEEKGPNNSPAQAQVVQLPAAICGRIEAAEDVDCFRFHAKAGAVLTFEVVCARLEDKIHDLQKHADPLLSLLDSRGKELVSNDDYFFADPYVVFQAPADGDYVVQIRDVKYDGDPRWVYVLLATDRPHVAQVFPMVGRAGESLSVEIMGSASKLQKAAVVKLPKETGMHSLRIPLGAAWSNSVPFLISDLPQMRELEPNDKLERAQGLPIPCGVSGRIDKPRDVDYYSFHGHKGEPLVFEIKARRFGTSWCSTLDSVLDILDEKAKVLATNDDSFGKDSRIVFAPPADGIYYVRVQDLHHRGGPTSIYYLEATKAEPDFKLRFDPDKIAVGPGSSAACYVQVERSNGFTGPVAVALEGLPAGLSASPLTIPPSMTQGLLVVTAAPDAQRDATVFRVVGTALVAAEQSVKKTIVHEAAAKEEIYLPGGGRGLFDIHMAVAAVTSAPDIVKIQVEPDVIVLAPGQEVRLKVRIQRRLDFDKGVSLDVLLRHLGSVFGNPLPPGVTLAEDKSKTLLGTGNEGVIVLKAAADAKPIERVPISVLANVSVNFMVKMSYSSPVVWLSVRKSP
jgi:hypothetical protein